MCGFLIGLCLATAWQQRDVAPSVPGSASIAGVVIDAGDNTPVRRAQVFLTSGNFSAEINTDSSGAFRFDRVSAGRYQIVVRATRYVPVTAESESSKPPRIVVADGQHVTGVTIAITRGAVVSGVLTESSGKPLPNAGVSLMRWGGASATGERTLVNVAIAPTDVRGVYRIRGVPAGEYVIATSGESMFGGLRSDGTNEQVQVLAHADVEAARRAMALPVSDVRSSTPLPTVAARRSMNATTFYPGTMSASQAAAINVAAGEERSGLDFVMQTVTANSVHGRIVPSGGATAIRSTVRLFPTVTDPIRANVTSFASVGADGSFAISGVPPGEYLLNAQSFFAARPSASGEVSSTPEMWTASATITILDAQDLNDVILTTMPGVTVSGRVRFEGATPTAEQLSTLRIRLKAILAPGEMSASGPPASVDASGRFALSSVTPGRYVAAFEASSSEGRTWQTWWLKSATVNNRDFADTPAELGAGDVSDVVMTLSSRSASLSGTAKAADGAPADGFVVVFAVDQSQWRTQSRRMSIARIGLDGTFGIGNLPPGDYFVAAVDRVSPGQLGDPSFLQGLVTSALRMTLAEGEQKTLAINHKKN